MPIRVVDGDTIDVDVDLGFHVRMAMKIRLLGINAPEMSTPAGKPAKEYLTSLVGSGPLRLRTFKDRTEKYGRYLGELWREESPTSGPSINDVMIADGHAVPYP